MARSKAELEAALKKLDGVYKTTASASQRERVFRQIREIKRLLESIPEGGEFPAGDADIMVDLELDNITRAEQTAGTAAEPEEKKPLPAQKSAPPPAYTCIIGVEVKPVHPLCGNDDANFLAAMFKEFEDEYWGAISDYHLKLDYNHSNKRDGFFNKLESNKRLLKELIKIFEQMESTTRSEFKLQLQTMAAKQERNFIIEGVNYFYALFELLDLLATDYDNRGNIILNADDEVRFGKLYGDKKLSGMSIIDAVKRTRLFLREVLDFLNLPNLYKKGG